MEISLRIGFGAGKAASFSLLSPWLSVGRMVCDRIIEISVGVLGLWSALIYFEREVRIVFSE